MHYHIWFGTKYRRRVLVAEIGEYVENQFRAIASSKSIRLLECKCYVDHAHLLLLDVSESYLPNAIRLLRGGSAYRTFRRFPELKLDASTQHLWRRGYGRRRVPLDQIEAVRHYVRTQEDRPDAFDRSYGRVRR